MLIYRNFNDWVCLHYKERRGRKERNTRTNSENNDAITAVFPTREIRLTVRADFRNSHRRNYGGGNFARPTLTNIFGRRNCGVSFRDAIQPCVGAKFWKLPPAQL